MKLNVYKLQYRVKAVKYVGHVYSGEGISIDNVRIDSIKNFKEPKKLKSYRVF